MSDVRAQCIRSGDEGGECRGHECCACGREFFCGKKHKCPPRQERTATGIERRQTFGERLSSGMAMLGRD